MKKFTFILLSIFLITGCAASPKPLTLAPEVIQEEVTMGEDKGVSEIEKEILDKPPIEPNAQTPVESAKDTPLVEENNEAPSTPVVNVQEEVEKKKDAADPVPQSKPSSNPPKVVLAAKAEVVPKPEPSPTPTPEPPAPQTQLDPAPKEKWQVPNLVGLGKDHAESELITLNTKMKNLGFSPMKISFTEENHASVAKGSVIRQSITAGSYDSISEISLCISLGAPVVTNEKTLPNNYPAEYQSALEQEVFTLVNEHRINNGLSHLLGVIL